MDEIVGLNECLDNIEKIKAKLTPDQIEPVLLQGASIIAQAVINKAPQGPTGNLKRAIMTNLLPRLKPDQPGSAIAIVRGGIAPHAHLVEYGHFQTKTRGGLASRWVPPHPFFRPAVEETGDSVIEAVIAELNTMIEGSL